MGKIKWKPIPGWAQYYEVSNRGRVRSLDRVVFCVRNGRANPRRFKSRLLAKSSNKYPIVALSRPGRKPKCYNVHSLVTLAFVGEPPTGLEVCHNDGDPHNNSLCNLRYDTRSSNSLDRHKHGTVRVRRGHQAYNSKLTPPMVKEIRRSSLSSRNLGRKFSVSHGTILAVRNRERYL